MIKKIKNIVLSCDTVGDLFDGTPEQFQDNFGYVQGGGPVTAVFVESVAERFDAEIDISFEDEYLQ